MSVKTLYTFSLEKEVEKDVTEQVDGGTLTKKVKENVPVTFAIRKPNRNLIDQAELFYGVEYNNAIRAGFLPKALLAKRLDNDNGVFSDKQKEEQEKLLARFLELNNEIVQYNLKKDEEHTDKEKEDIKPIFGEYQTIRNRLVEYDNAQQSMYDNTAETRALIKSIFWYALFLAYQEDGKGGWKSLFEGETFADKVKEYDKIEDNEDEFLTKVAQRFYYFVSAIRLGRANTKEDFDALNEKFEDVKKEADKPVEEAKPEVKTEEAPTPESI